MRESIIIPRSREDFVAHILLRLGDLTTVNVSRPAIEIRIEEALKLYREWHDDASYDSIVARRITQEDIDNNYIQLDDKIHRVETLLDSSSGVSSDDTMWFPGTSGINQSIRGSRLNTGVGVGQMPLTSFFLRRRSKSDAEYYSTYQHKWDFDFYNKILRIENFENVISLDDFILFNCSVLIDEIWSDNWLIRYVTELVRLQWGLNLSKFTNMQLPGGMELNSSDMISYAKEELIILNKELRDEHGNYSFITTG